jgi:hypothetical protein
VVVVLRSHVGDDTGGLSHKSHVRTKEVPQDFVVHHVPSKGRVRLLSLRDIRQSTHSLPQTPNIRLLEKQQKIQNDLIVFGHVYFVSIVDGQSAKSASGFAAHIYIQSARAESQWVVHCAFHHRTTILWNGTNTS